MTLYPEMFISIWHVAVLILGVIAWIAMVAGGYERKTVFKSTAGAFIAFYVIVTIPVAVATYDLKYTEQQMFESLQEHYERKMVDYSDPSELDKVVLSVGVFENRDGDYQMKVYAGNFSETLEFKGEVTVYFYDENDKKIKDETYEHISLKPGEKKEIDSFWGENQTGTYRYFFEEDVE
ncbi:hypothetical protein [Marinicrinis lubricantis]|uniref:Uncharacterized protein n=1 Tax=Marinicrinis lubricantis TaxID=2086470 RepID=A0ABW1IV79_9BACL